MVKIHLGVFFHYQGVNYSDGWLYLRGDKNKSGLLSLDAKFSANMEHTKTYHIPNKWKFHEDFAELWIFWIAALIGCYN